MNHVPSCFPEDTLLTSPRMSPGRYILVAVILPQIVMLIAFDNNLNADIEEFGS